MGVAPAQLLVGDESSVPRPALVTGADLRWRTRAAMSRSHVLNAPYRLYRSVRHPEGQRWVTRRTDVLIDGFQGSGNTFTTRAFRAAQERPVDIAHHVHCSEQVRHAVRRSVPTLLLIRDPRGAVVSTARRWPGPDISLILRSWIRYYEDVVELLPDVVVMPFSVVTADHAVAVGALNQRYGTSFASLDPEAQQDPALRPVRESRRARLDDDRDQAAARLEDCCGVGDLARADSLYERIAAHGPQPEDVVGDVVQ